MQENVVGTAHLIHNSVSELNRAIHAAHTTLNNSINAFNALNFNKFLENVIEEPSTTPGATAGADEETTSSTIFGDLRGEDEKLTQALEMAFNEISKEKVEEGDEEEKKANKAQQDKGAKKPLGTHAMIKLPYVIGTKEFDEHPFAGLVYLGIKGLEQDDLHKNELQ